MTDTLAPPEPADPSEIAVISDPSNGPSVFGYPFTAPKLSDPRLHVAAVILTVHTIGQLGLGFRVSVPQIAAAILSAAVVDVVIAFVRSGTVVWPASAMLTGSGVALILRLDGMEAGQPWSFDRWWWFAGISVAALATKHLIRYRNSHVFNPSNVGLVAAFIIFGMDRIEPLDFWWGALDGWLLLAYSVILGGGILINARLGLLDMLAAYYVVLFAGIMALAVTGHCMTVPWTLDPVCDMDYGRVVLTSPETMVFLLFMISDPRTIPTSRTGRLIFATAVGSLGVVFMAPQTTEFWTKVGLLGGLTVTSAGWWIGRLIVDRRQVTQAGAGVARLGPRHGLVALAAATFAVMPIAVALGDDARTLDPTGYAALPDVGHLLTPVDPLGLPVVVDETAIEFRGFYRDEALARDLAATLVALLDVENQLIASGDVETLAGVSHGQRLAASQERARAVNAGEIVDLYDYDFESLRLVAVRSSTQGTVRLAFEATGEVTASSMQRDGDDLIEIDRVDEPFHGVFVLWETRVGPWLIVDQVDEVQPLF